MNAKKIMGAVLVALLAAALFIGVGAAATDNGTVFVYQVTPNAEGTWKLGASTITAIQATSGGYYFAGDKIVEGTYKKGDYEITVKYPTATITGLATDGNLKYIIDGGVLYQGSNADFEIKFPATGVTIKNVLVTYPNGSVIANFSKTFTASPLRLTAAETNALPVGKYTLQAVFDNGNGFAPGTPESILNSKAVYTFNVASSTDATITTKVDSVLEKEIFPVVITGKPGETYNLTGDSFEIASYGGNAVNAVEYSILMPNDGKATVYLKALDAGNGKLTVEKDTKTVKLSLKIVEGTITAEAEKESYYIGNDIKLTGTSTAGDSLSLYWAGTNAQFKLIKADAISVEDGKWKYELLASDLKVKGQNPDAGTYTLYISTNSSAATVNNLNTYTTVALILKQPFISITDAPDVAVKGNIYEVKGNAEAASDLQVYIFGTNFFKYANKTPSTDTYAITNEGKPVVSFDENKFTIKAEIPTEGMASGQYFLVVQHPMYDKKFNIWANGSKIMTAPTVYGALDLNNMSTLFDVFDRQKTNAAQALCDALDTQNVDDMYVKSSFVVAPATSVINPIPEQITIGSKLTVSGQTNAGKGKVVTVEMLATAFAAQPKETVGSASFIALSTKSNEDGTWEVTFDTSNLEAGEYTLTAAIESLDSSATTKINVIEGAPVKPTETVVPTETEQPTQPTQTQTQPTTPPKTPGFGALAALAGLGAVAVLLLRRE